MFLGLPAGIFTGAIASAIVLRYVGHHGKNDPQALARGLGVFGASVIVAVVAGLFLPDIGVTVVLLGATLIGIVAGAIAASRSHPARQRKEH